jgi:hypothetical protein
VLFEVGQVRPGGEACGGPVLGNQGQAVFPEQGQNSFFCARSKGRWVSTPS